MIVLATTGGHRSLVRLLKTLYELAQHCDFGVANGEHILDRIVIGIMDSEVSEWLQLEPGLTLESQTEITAMVK